jgi:hypothetical protein
MCLFIRFYCFMNYVYLHTRSAIVFLMYLYHILAIVYNYLS